ncbi:MAG: HEAT repeat domain-containing protein [Thiohalomonas sp.]|nr:HEAT repeat domain-containing protein [Thiohalomonas sp.]
MRHKVTNSLLNYLENGNEVDRCYAAKTLGNLKVKEATSALLERIKDEDIDVCIDAISALGKIKEPSAIPVLLESLEKDPDGDIKLAVTESLTQYQSDEAINALLKLAEDRPEQMEFDQNADWDSWWDLQEKAIVILGKMKVKKAFPILKTILEDEFAQDIEAIILKAIAKLDDEEADAYLITRLNNAASEFQERQQRRAATALGFSQSPTTLKALGRALVSKSEETRENVIYALGKRKASQYIKAIVLSLRDESANVKRAALEVLQQLATESQSNSEFDFNQIATMLDIQQPNKDDIVLQAAILTFFQEQQKIAPVIKTLSEQNQQLFVNCLNAQDDKVLTQAAQLAGITLNPDSVAPLFELALSENQSAWVRKEAILALGHVINSITETAEKQTALLNLRQLVHNDEQAVRSSALQALLTLSNHSETMSADAESDDLAPISILLATLKGEQFALEEESNEENNTACSTGEQPRESNCGSCAQSAPCSDEAKVTKEIMKQFDMQAIDDSTDLIAANEDQTISPSMSTLDAILMDNVESAQAVVPETEAEKAHDKESGPFVSEELDEDMDKFVALMQKNFTRGKKMVRRKVDTFADARHICARLLADNSQPQYDEMIVNALAEYLNDDDEYLRQEAAESLSQISLKNPLIPGLNNTFGKLLTLLDSKDSDMRIACIHALAHSGNRAALPHLLDYLSDSEYLVQLHALHGLVYILTNKANLTKAQQSEHMVIEGITNEQVITAIFDCLKNKNYSISMAAIEALTELQQTEAIEKFIDVALSGEGQSARRISGLLKKLDTEKSTELLLTRLDKVTDSSYRRYVMEMLEVVVSPDEEQK